MFGGREYKSRLEVVIFSPSEPGESVNVGCFGEGLERSVKREASMRDTLGDKRC